MRKFPVVWVVLADGEHARVVMPTVSRGQFATSQAFDSAMARQRSAEIAGSALGRAFESGDGTRHAIAPRVDPHRQAKHDFAVEVAHWVGAEATQGAFDRLVLVAPSHALSAIRAALPAAAAERLVGTLAKDLLKTPERDLAAHLAEWWVHPNEPEA